MKRRDPTRIELKLDDIQEYEQMKRDLEKKGKQADDTNTVMQQESTTGGGTEATIAEGAISRTETIHRRIGYDPAPKMSWIKSRISNSRWDLIIIEKPRVHAFDASYPILVHMYLDFMISISDFFY